MTPAIDELRGLLERAIIAGLRSFESDQPDFSMSSAMRTNAADHILAQPGIWPALPSGAGLDMGNPVEQALLRDADTDLAPFRPGDPGKHVQTLIPTPEWKALAKAADRRGSSLSRMLRIAVRHYLVWLSAYRTPMEAAADTVNALPSLLSRLASLEAGAEPLFEALAHGDDAHREWLREAIHCWFAGRPVPAATGDGRKDARITSLEAENAALREAGRNLLSHRVGDLPSKGWLHDTDRSRAALAELAALTLNRSNPNG